MPDESDKPILKNISFLHAGCVNFFGLTDEDDIAFARSFAQKVAAQNDGNKDVIPLDMRIFDELKKRGF